MSETESPQAQSAVEEILEYDGRFFTLRYVDLIPPQSPEDDAALETSIRERGVIMDVVHTPDDVILDGASRLRKAKRLGIPLKDVPLKLVAVPTAEDEVNLAVELNVNRRQMTWEHFRALARHLRHTRKWTIKRISQTIGRSESVVHGYLNSQDAEDGVAPDVIVSADGKVRPATYQPRQPDPDTSNSATEFHSDVKTGEAVGVVEPETSRWPQDVKKLKQLFHKRVMDCIAIADEIDKVGNPRNGRVSGSLKAKIQPHVQRAYDLVFNVPEL